MEYFQPFQILNTFPILECLYGVSLTNTKSWHVSAIECMQSLAPKMRLEWVLVLDCFKAWVAGLAPAMHPERVSILHNLYNESSANEESSYLSTVGSRQKESCANDGSWKRFGP
jgi:hypothetical protein